MAKLSRGPKPGTTYKKAGTNTLRQDPYRIALVGVFFVRDRHNANP